MSSSSDSDFDFIEWLTTPKPPRIRTRVDYLGTLDDTEFLQRFRMSKGSFRLLLEKIRQDISPLTLR